MSKKMIVTLLFLAIIIVAIISIFSFSSQIGTKPKGERLERILKSENYQNEIFQNKDETNMDKPPIEGIKEMMKKGVDRTPEGPLSTLSFDKADFENAGKDEIRFVWLGHSTFLLKMNGVTILVDPVFAKRASMFQFMGPKKFDYSCDYLLTDLPNIDLVLISHDHYDHLDFDAIKILKNSVDQFYMPLGVGAHMEHWGVKPDQITEFDWWESISFGGVNFTATPGRHFTGRMLSDRFKSLWCGWAIKSSKHNIYYSGDSGYFDGFKTIGEKLGPFDFALLECGQYSKFWPYIHMMPEESVQAAIDVKAEVAMPVHWGKFKLSIHPWYEPPTRFLKKADAENLKVASPKIGEVFSLDNIPVQRWWQN